MPYDQDRWRRLIAFDAHAMTFIAHGRESVEMGDAIAETDIGRLWALAGGVARALTSWREEIALLDLARGAPLTPQRAARLISESLFDQALAPLAHPVFNRALDLALHAGAEAAQGPS